MPEAKLFERVFIRPVWSTVRTSGIGFRLGFRGGGRWRLCMVVGDYYYVPDSALVMASHMGL